MGLIYPGQTQYDRLDEQDLEFSWRPVPGREAGRFDLLVVGQIERFGDDVPTEQRSFGAPTYGSAFRRRVSGAMRSDAIAMDLVALKATALLADYFARRRLGRAGQWLMRILLQRMMGGNSR